MPVKINTSARIRLEDITEQLMPDIFEILNGEKNELEEDIKNRWVNPDNARDHVDGSPSQSKGTSSEAWDGTVELSRAKAVMRMVNDVDYAQYVRFSGDVEGDSAVFAAGQFAASVSRITDEINDLIAKTAKDAI